MSQAMKIKPFWCFNSRSHVGSNPTASGASNDSMTFQLTLPRRERYDTFGTSRHITNLRFNSRSHVGSDKYDCYKGVNLARFNSRSHVGSVSPSFLIARTQLCFNSRSHVRSDILGMRIYAFLSSFNSRSHVGSDIVMVAVKYKLLFQFTLPRRERLISATAAFIHRLFQLTLPRREQLTTTAILDNLLPVSTHAPA